MNARAGKPNEAAAKLARPLAGATELRRLARELAADPAQSVTFHMRNGREYVRIESSHAPGSVVDQPATDVDRARWSAEYAAFRAQGKQTEK